MDPIPFSFWLTFQGESYHVDGYATHNHDCDITGGPAVELQDWECLPDVPCGQVKAFEAAITEWLDERNILSWGAV